MIEVRVGAGVTVSKVEPVTPFIVAEIDEVPTVTPVATPAALMVATAGVAEAQVTRPVMSCVVLLEKVPMALNGSVAPTAMLGVAGVTAIDWRVAALTVSTVEPVMPLSVAEIDEVPAATPVANPAALMVATAVVAEAQVTWLVMFCVELSENVPVAVNCSVVPDTMLGLAGVTAIEVRVAAGSTVMVPAMPVVVPFQLSDP